MAITGVSFTGTISTTPNRPTTDGDGNFRESFDVSEPDAQANLTGAVKNEGMYQDMTAIIGAVCAAYASAYTDETNQQVSPFTIACLMRDTLQRMTSQRQFRAI